MNHLNELPVVSHTTYDSYACSAANQWSREGDHSLLGGQRRIDPFEIKEPSLYDEVKDLVGSPLNPPNHPFTTNITKEQPMSTARIVKVYIADPNEDLPLEKRILYSSEEKFTDLTDQELFFEAPINELLARHNEFRKTVIDKKQAEKFGRDIFLEPVRIRDLKMVVVQVAQF